MDVKTLAVFGTGLVVGGIITKIVDKKKLDRLDIFEHEVQKRNRVLNNEREEIKSSEESEPTNDRESLVQSESDGREESDSSWSKDDQERVSAFLHDNEYLGSSNEEFENSSMETGNVMQLMVENEDGLKLSKTIDITNADKNDGDKETETISFQPDRNVIKEIEAVDFVKAVASGHDMRSFIFNTLDHLLYWNFTNEPLTDDELRNYVGKDVWDKICDECQTPPYSFIQSKYLYNSGDDSYVKIENGIVLRDE